MERSRIRGGALVVALCTVAALGGCTEGSTTSPADALPETSVRDEPVSGVPDLSVGDGAFAGPNFDFALGETYRTDVPMSGPTGERLEAFFRVALDPLQDLSGLLERPVSVRYERCGQANAFHDRATDTITLCHELSEYAAGLFEPLVDPASNDPDGILEGYVLVSMGFVLYHEIAHALDFQRDLPIVGNFESAMDSIATVIAVETGRYLYSLGGGALFGREATSLTGQHGGGLDRLGDINCWTLGGETLVESTLVDPELAETFDLRGGGARLRGGVRAAARHGPLLGAGAEPARARRVRSGWWRDVRRLAAGPALRRSVARGQRFPTRRRGGAWSASSPRPSRRSSGSCPA